MATPEEQARRDEQQRRAAAAAVAGGTLVTVGDPEVAPAAGVPSVAARATAAGTILAALVAFLAVQRARLRAWLGEQMRRRQPTVAQSDIDRLLDEEQRRQAVFETKQAERFSRDLTTALAIPDAAAREGAIRGLVNREKRYARQREEAMAARAFAAIDRVVLRQQSPNGAFWQLDPTVIEHTAGCLIMGNKFWPWAVLDRVHPPRHAGCPCRLRGYGEAIADGVMAPGAVLDVQVAIRRAAAVVMEGALRIEPSDADALIEMARESEPEGLREALVAAGLADEDALDEAFDAKQPRDFRGRWKDILGGIEKAHPDVSLSSSANDDGIVLSKIGVNEAARGKGAASKALDALLAAADREGKVVALTPDPIGKGGLSKSALTKWYRSKGFVPNKGRAKDYAFRETMIRQPQAREALVEDFDANQPRDPGGEGGGQWAKHPFGATAKKAGAKVARLVSGTQAQHGEAIAGGVAAWYEFEGGMPKDAPTAEQIAKNWTKPFRGRMSKDAAAKSKVEAALAENDSNPAWRALQKRYVPDQVIVVTKPEPGKFGPLLDHGELASAHRVAKGTTVLWDANVAMIELDAKGKSLGPGQSGSTRFGLAAVLRHEYGHDLVNALGGEKAIRPLVEGIKDPAKNVTRYAATNASELFCELMAIRFDPRWKADDWDPTVVTATEKILAALGLSGGAA